jgi:hypothetical protein
MPQCTNPPRGSAKTEKPRLPKCTALPRAFWTADSIFNHATKAIEIVEETRSSRKEAAGRKFGIRSSKESEKHGRGVSIRTGGSAAPVDRRFHARKGDMRNRRSVSHVGRKHLQRVAFCGIKGLYKDS